MLRKWWRRHQDRKNLSMVWEGIKLVYPKASILSRCEIGMAFLGLVREYGDTWGLEDGVVELMRTRLGDLYELSTNGPFTEK